MQFPSLLAGSRPAAGADQVGRVAELSQALREARSVMSEMQGQLEAAQKALADERARSASLSARLERLESVSRYPDPNEWGLEPGVGI